MSNDKIPGVPEGWEVEHVSRFGEIGEHCVNPEGKPHLIKCGTIQRVCIIRKIEKPATYRPFANAEEFKPHRDRWICRLYNGRPNAKGCYKVSAYDDRGTFANDGKTSYQDMFEEGRVFDDGTPFGVRIDE